jgi:hypothetical protein
MTTRKKTTKGGRRVAELKEEDYKELDDQEQE